MKYLFTIFFSCFFLTTAFSQNENVELLGSLNPHSGKRYTDIWGYVDGNGREYAIMGVQNGTSIIDVTNPSNPVEVAFINGPEKSPYHHRDIKTHDHYAYVTTEANSYTVGLQIIDLSQLPAAATLVNDLQTYFTTAHNLYIADGYAYVVGTSGAGGIHVLDLSDPVNPVRTAYYTESGYVHDLYVWDDTIYASSRDTYDLIDITDKSNPTLISVSAALPGIYAHSGWLTEDKRYFIAAEEYNERDLMVWDLQDRTTWDLVVSEWQMPGDSRIHNIFVKNNFAHISYYKEGYVVLDITDPTNPLKVGQYDTYFGTSGTFIGAWGVYPYLPSGNVLISDITTGLYVFNFLLDDNLPVELLSFSANFYNNKIELNWSTATEINNMGFEIQKSSDKNSWFSCGFINGAGNSTENNSYTFYDETPLSWKSYYRIVQIDFDGTKKIYDAVEVVSASLLDYKIEQNYPNPFNPSTIISYSVPEDNFVNLSVFNSIGQKVADLVNENVSAGNYEVTFNGKDLPSGIYIAMLNSGKYKSNIKMSLIK